MIIQDIQQDVAHPTVFTPGEPNYHQGNIVTSVSWNKVVPHILASASEDGTVVVWDLKNSQAIFNFKNPDLAAYDYDPVTGKQEKKATAHHIVWSPTAPTQFLLSNDNGDQSTMTLWDLRAPDYP